METDKVNREVSEGTLRIRVRSGDSTLTLSVSGEVDLANAETLSAELDGLAKSDAATITVDLSDLEFIDSTGIAVLVAAHHKLEKCDAEVRLVRSRASAVCRVLEITGLDSALPFVDPEAGEKPPE